MSDANDNNTSKKSGFERTLLGEQEWPPKKVVISDKRESYNLWVKLNTESPFEEKLPKARPALTTINHTPKET